MERNQEKDMKEKISKFKPIELFFRRSSEVNSFPQGRKKYFNSARKFSPLKNGQNFSPMRNSLTIMLTFGVKSGQEEKAKYEF